MLTIRKICVLVSIFWFSVAAVNAESDSVQGRRYILSVTPLVGILNGHAEEIVYKYPEKDVNLSQLLWDIKPQIYMGLSVDYVPTDCFHNFGLIAGSTIKVGIPGLSGAIEDRDWTNTQYDHLTLYSRHKAVSKVSIVSETSAGYSLPLKDYFALGFFGEFTYMHFSWAAKDGYTQYWPGDRNTAPPWDPSLPKDYVQGECILYKQNWFIFTPGASLKWKLGGGFFLEGTFCFSPFVYCADRDDHLATGVTFLDYALFGHYINGGGKISFSEKNIKASIACNYRHINRLRGSTYEQVGSNPVYQTSKDGSGMGFSAIDLEFAFSIGVY